MIMLITLYLLSSANLYSQSLPFTEPDSMVQRSVESNELEQPFDVKEVDQELTKLTRELTDILNQVIKISQEHINASSSSPTYQSHQNSDNKQESREEQSNNEFYQEVMQAAFMQQLKQFLPGGNDPAMQARLESLTRIFAQAWPHIRDYFRQNPTIFADTMKRLVTGFRGLFGISSQQ